MPTELFCNVAIDYSLVPDSTLPFRVELDLVNSNLTPGLGENQKFCYIVTGVGEDIPELKDLSHWVLGICPDITEDDFVVDSITVEIDGESQEVIWGDNVELVDPDPTTQCSGLKFDFAVDKVEGVMNVCFEMTTPYEIGSNLVCLKGGEDSVESGLTICGPACEPTGCETLTYQPATVCAPVEVTPEANLGDVTTTCCGEAVVTPGATTCPFEARSCHFTVEQRICIEVPITFSAKADVGELTVDCEDANIEGCPDCDSLESL